jgi:hypothetical protein
MSPGSSGFSGMSRDSREVPVARHGFLMLGTKNLYLCHLPMYRHAAHVFQTILEAEIEASEMKKYLKLRSENPSRPIILLNQQPMVLKELANSKSFFGEIYFSNQDGDPDPPGSDPLGTTDVKVNKILLFNRLNENSPDYPEHLQYYLFGTNSDWHLSHLLSKAPNFEQELDISISGSEPDNKESEIFKVSIPSVDERSKQPITEDPLTRSDYEIVTEKADKFQASIINRFWINNTMLN